MSKAFTPVPNGTVNIDVSTSSQRVLIGNPDQVRICNDGSATVFVAFGSSSITTTTSTGFPVGPGVVEVLTVPPSLNSAPAYASAIGSGSTGKIYFTPGSGV